MRKALTAFTTAVIMAVVGIAGIAPAPAGASPSVITLHLSDGRHRDTGRVYHTFHIHYLWKIPLQDGAVDWLKFTSWSETAHQDTARNPQCGFWSQDGYTGTTVRLYVSNPYTGRHIYMKGQLPCVSHETSFFYKGMSHTPRIYLPTQDPTVNFKVLGVDHFVWHDDKHWQFSGHLKLP